MFQRCNRPNFLDYKNYGGRGITVCERWRSFENFLKDMGERPLGTSIHRINNDLGYSPDNCRWATFKEQQNKKRTCRYLTFNGDTKTITEWAEQFSINIGTLTYRIRKGWPLEMALTDKAHERGWRYLYR